jgi:hypothetical protein
MHQKVEFMTDVLQCMGGKMQCKTDVLQQMTGYTVQTDKANLADKQ